MKVTRERWREDDVSRDISKKGGIQGGKDGGRPR